MTAQANAEDPLFHPLGLDKLSAAFAGVSIRKSIPSRKCMLLTHFKAAAPVARSGGIWSEHISILCLLSGPRDSFSAWLNADNPVGDSHDTGFSPQPQHEDQEGVNQPGI